MIHDLIMFLFGIVPGIGIGIMFGPSFHEMMDRRARRQSERRVKREWIA